MACSYLKKKKLYSLACLLFPEIAFPKMKDCSYYSGYGREGIEFVLGDDFARLSCLPANEWFHLLVRNEDGVILRDSVRVLSDFTAPIITYISDREPVLMPEYMEG